jgi:hypothetical protein
MKNNLENNKKIYSSYEEIDTDLAIIRLEREIHYQKAILHFKKTKGTLAPDKLVTETINSFTGGFSGIVRSLSGLFILFLARRILRKSKYLARLFPTE